MQQPHSGENNKNSSSNNDKMSTSPTQQKSTGLQQAASQVKNNEGPKEDNSTSSNTRTSIKEGDSTDVSFNIPTVTSDHNAEVHPNMNVNEDVSSVSAVGNEPREIATKARRVEEVAEVVALSKEEAATSAADEYEDGDEDDDDDDDDDDYYSQPGRTPYKDASLGLLGLLNSSKAILTNSSNSDNKDHYACALSQR